MMEDEFRATEDSLSVSMPDVFLSYAREDRDLAEAVTARLEEAGFDVWWDRHLQPGRAFHDVLQEKLESSRCVVVLWSQHSTTSDWVIEEAEEARQKRRLVPVTLGPLSPPLGFRRIQSIPTPEDAKHWTARHFLAIEEAVRRVIKTQLRTAYEPTEATPLIQREDADDSIPIEMWLRTGPLSPTFWAASLLAVTQLLVAFGPIVADRGRMLLITPAMVGLVVGAWVGVAGYRQGRWTLMVAGWVVPPFFCLISLPQSRLQLSEIMEISLAYGSLFLLFVALKASQTRRAPRLGTRRPWRLLIITQFFLLGLMIFVCLDEYFKFYLLTNSLDPLRYLALSLLPISSVLTYLGCLQKRRAAPVLELGVVLLVIALLGGKVNVQVQDPVDRPARNETILFSPLLSSVVTNSAGAIRFAMVPIGTYRVAGLDQAQNLRSIKIRVQPLMTTQVKLSLDDSTTIGLTTDGNALVIALVEISLAALLTLIVYRQDLTKVLRIER